METDFSNQYAHLSDDELLEIASDQPSLTDDAKSALDAEMSKRRLTLTDVQEHQRLVERSRRKETRRRNRKLFGSRQDRQTKIQTVVNFFWLALAMAAVTIVYLSVPTRYRLSASWEETALFVMLGSGTILVAGSSLWRKTRFWFSLLVSSTGHALLVHTWIVRAGSLVEKDLVYGELAILAGPLLFAAVYGVVHQFRRKLYPEAANQERGPSSPLTYLGVPRRRLLVIIAVGVVAALSPLMLLEGTIAYGSLREYLHRRPFNSAAWRDLEQVEGRDPVRIRMVDDLIKSHRLDHLSRAEVENLLGKPTKTQYFHEHDLVYWLGPERGFMGIDSEWLVIDLDDRGIVRKYAVVRD